MRFHDLVQDVVIPEDCRNVFRSDAPGSSLACTSRLNLIIGANNAGKSRLLRSLFANADRLRCRLASPERQVIDDHIAKACSLVNTIQDKSQIASLKAFLDHPLYDVDINSFSRTNRFPEDVFAKANREVSHLRSDGRSSGKADKLDECLVNIKRLVIRYIDRPVTTNLDPRLQLIGWSYRYAPALRSMRFREDSQSSLLARLALTDYFSARPGRFRGAGSSDDLVRQHGSEIVSGADLFDRMQSLMLGSREQRAVVPRLEERLSRYFFGGADVQVIPRRDKGAVYFRVGNSAERAIHEWGDAVQQIVTMLLPIVEFENRPLMYFLEEPEVYLHAGWQRMLAKAVIEAPNSLLVVFASTHSTYFLDICEMLGDSSFCQLRVDGEIDLALPEGGFDSIVSIRCRKSADLDIIRELGVLPSAVLLANCSVWVEGITDRLYFSRLFKLLVESDPEFCQDTRLIEGINYAFVEYGGAAVTHLGETDDEERMNLTRLCGRAILIVDADSHRKGDRGQVLSEIFKDRYFPLNVEELECLLPPDIVRRVVKRYEGEDVPFREFTHEEYRMTKLGGFIDTIWPDGTRSKRLRRTGDGDGAGGAYGTKTGTIKSKLEFWRYAISELDELGRFGSEAIDFGRSLLRRIRDISVC